MLDVILDTTIDALKILPFLFLTYIVMEYIEHKMSEKTKTLIQKSGKVGPLYGGILGILPQCGFSAAASNLYVARIITLGTLIAVYLSTSDEMLPILISEQVSVGIIIKILLLKAFIGILAGFIIDFVLRKKEKQTENIKHLCEHEHCHCNEKNILISALKHSLNIFIFIFTGGIFNGKKNEDHGWKPRSSSRFLCVYRRCSYLSYYPIFSYGGSHR